MFHLKKNTLVTKFPNINNLKQCEYKFYIIITSYIVLIRKIHTSVLVCRVPRIHLGSDWAVWLADPSGSYDGTCPLLCPARFEVCRLMSRSLSFAAEFLEITYPGEGEIHVWHCPLLDLIQNVSLGWEWILITKYALFLLGHLQQKYQRSLNFTHLKLTLLRVSVCFL